jgi:hypothetical protein
MVNGVLYLYALSSVSSMKRLSEGVTALAKDSKSNRFKSVFRAEQIKEALSSYHAEINSLRENLMVRHTYAWCV